MLTETSSRTGSWDQAVSAGTEAAPAERTSGCPFSAMSTAVKNLTGRTTLSTVEPAAPESAGERFSRVAIFAYGLIAYALFAVTLLYAIGWVGNWFVPRSIDTGTPAPLLTALLVNSIGLVLFVVQHTIMARPAFKAWWVRIIPRAIERSTFVIAATFCLALTMYLWRPIPTVVWSTSNPVAWWGLTALSLFGWGVMLTSSFMVSHFDLFGLRQTWFRFRGQRYRPVGFRLFGLYRLVRHPLMVGFLIAFWATPHMTVGHLFFSIMTTGYIFFGTWIEERDLIAEHGEDYLSYRRKVRGFLPIPKSA